MNQFDRDAFNEAYLEFSAYTKNITDAANKITKPHIAELEACIEQVLQCKERINELKHDIQVLKNRK